MEPKEPQFPQDVETGWQQATRHYRLLAGISDQALVDRPAPRPVEETTDPKQSDRARGGSY